WDAQGASGRRAPVVAEPRLQPLLAVDPVRSSFPSEHAAVAGAASTVLAYLFPDEPVERLTALAAEAADSPALGGASYRRDVEGGLARGRAVGERAVARGKADGSDRAWDGTGRRPGPGAWQPTPPDFVQEPLDPLAGTWLTWVVEDVRQLRPAA